VVGQRALGQTAAVALQLGSHHCHFGAQLVNSRLQLCGMDVFNGGGCSASSGLLCLIRSSVCPFQNSIGELSQAFSLSPMVLAPKERNFGGIDTDTPSVGDGILES
jgi:hypothetical protein